MLTIYRWIGQISLNWIANRVPNACHFYQNKKKIYFYFPKILLLLSSKMAGNLFSLSLFLTFFTVSSCARVFRKRTKTKIVKWVRGKIIIFTWELGFVQWLLPSGFVRVIKIITMVGGVRMGVTSLYGTGGQNVVSTSIYIYVYVYCIKWVYRLKTNLYGRTVLLSCRCN